VARIVIGSGAVRIGEPAERAGVSVRSLRYYAELVRTREALGALIVAARAAMAEALPAAARSLGVPGGR
jgi:hypothetical protein